VVSFTTRLLYPKGKSPWCPLDRRLSGPQSRSGRGGEEKNSQLLPELESPIVQPVAQRHTTELSRLRFETRSFTKIISVDSEDRTLRPDLIPVEMRKWVKALYQK
jgi:hypothetical protein